MAHLHQGLELLFREAGPQGPGLGPGLGRQEVDQSYQQRLDGAYEPLEGRQGAGHAAGVGFRPVNGVGLGGHLAEEK